MAVLPGITVLLATQRQLITNRRVGLVSNASATTPDLVSTVEMLRQTPNVPLTTLFAPEHGFQAAAYAGEAVTSTFDARTGLTIHSLYGETHKPTAAMLDSLDCLVFDIQTVGVRFYTYITTLLYVMQAAAEQSIPVILCDRPNPITGVIRDGPVLQTGFESFVGPGPLPMRHGLTIGELGRLYQQAWQVDCELTVIPCQGWQRTMWFDETGLVWVPPSPGIPKMDTALVYPGTCLIEGTNLSEGRGTALPFEIVGAPWIEGWQLAERLNAQQHPGVTFRPVQFQPTTSKWQGEVCNGVQLHVRNREVFQPLITALHLIATISAAYPTDFCWRTTHFDRLAGTNQLRQQLMDAAPIETIVDSWQADLAAFQAQAQACLLY